MMELHRALDHLSFLLTEDLLPKDDKEALQAILDFVEPLLDEDPGPLPDPNTCDWEGLL